MKIHICIFSPNLSRKFKYRNVTRITSTLHEVHYTCMTISRWFLLRMRNISDKSIDKIKTRILCSIIFSENRVVCKIMCKSIVEPDRTQMTIIWRMPFACWTAKTPDTHSENVIVLPRQQLLFFALLLPYTYIACLAYIVWYNQRKSRQILIVYHALLFTNSPYKNNSRAKAPEYAIHRLSNVVSFQIYIYIYIYIYLVLQSM
jgi:hypothetical protein